jgi:Uma2 family endonuclease
MGMPAAIRKEWTHEMWEKLPHQDGNRYEIIDGELVVSPSPTWDHQGVLGELYDPIKAYLRLHPIGLIRWSPADIRIDRRNVVQPDLFVAPRVDGVRPRGWREITSLLLVIEALSPRTARLDRIRKRPLYQRFNVPEYWIVDGDARLIERWRPSDTRPEILEDKIDWQPDPSLTPLVIDLPALFKIAYDE